MSDPLELRLKYDVPHDKVSMRTVLNVLRSAVAENWAERSTELCRPEPRYPVDVEGWLRQAFPGPSDDTTSDAPKRWDFSFSPTTECTAKLGVGRDYDGTIYLFLDTYQRVRFDGIKDLLEWREQDPDFRPPWPVFAPGGSDEEYFDWCEAEEAWWDAYAAKKYPSPGPNNRDCLLHLFDRLRQALPLREAKLDDRILNGLNPVPEKFARFAWKIPGVG